MSMLDSQTTADEPTKQQTGPQLGRETDRVDRGGRKNTKRWKGRNWEKMTGKYKKTG